MEAPALFICHFTSRKTSASWTDPNRLPRAGPVISYSLSWGKQTEKFCVVKSSPKSGEIYTEVNQWTSEAAQLCPTLGDPMDWRLPGSSIHGIFQARILEWVAISFSKGSSQPRDQAQVSRIAGRHFTFWATREATLK